MKIKPGNDVSIKRSIFFSLIFMATLSILLIGSTWYIIENQNLKRSIENLNSRELEIQKNYLKYEVNQVISDIEFRMEYNKEIPEDELKSIILDWIAQLRLVYGGYIFVNQTDGKALVFDGKKVEGYKNISDLTDPNGLRLFDIEKEAYSLPDGRYMEYLFKPMDSDIPEEKLSYIKGFPDWEWIIGAGIYKQAPAQMIKTLELAYYKNFEKELIAIALLSFILIVISYFIVKHIDSRLYSQINLLKGSLQKVAQKDNFINLDKIQFDELKKIAGSVNEMIQQKMNLTMEILEKDQNLKSIFEAAEDVGFIITELKDNKAIIREFSPGAEKMLGYKKQEIIGQEAIVIHYKEDYTNFLKIQNLLLNGLKGFNGETRLVLKNKSTVTVLFSMHPLISNNNTMNIIAVIIDISKRKNAEKELEKLKNELEEKVAERTLEIVEKNKELTKKNEELEHYNNLFVGREFRINELKIKIKELEEAIARRN
ncbi:MAG: cache domain-containing protein [Prolixibacteraceae bacterium]|nr:cache domain-containing protein [Prolixibacteraceae bacterium]MBN2773486.1 cache domain-containing protein [Prolixibacteraceae bacterium]